ncbi:MAG: hypothetical protein Q8N05_15970 [Bacteroidota bacterium]|nr:hypothetical protein [Bacteroidota bacterium]
MYEVFLMFHSWLRWLLLFSMAVTLIKYLAGWLGNQPWKKLDNVLGIVFTSLMDLQLIFGLGLYFFLSPVTKQIFANFGAAMKDAVLRFYAVEHISMMLIALVLVHIGRAKSKKAKIDRNKFKIASIFFLIALALIFAAIPWNKL